MTMTRATPCSPDPAATALGLLGMVVALIFFVQQRLLPRLRTCPEAAAAMLEVQLAMAALAGAAWAQVEAPRTGAAAERHLEACARRMRDSLAALVACLARRVRRPFPAGRGHAARPALRPSCAMPAAAPSPRARDGPPRAA